jgi:hypothetical protein
MDFINTGESSYYYNRRRDQRDDFQPQANPSGIRADVSPSVRAVQSSSAVETPDPGLMMARGLQGQHDAIRAMREAFTNMPQAIFQGEVPRIDSANIAPSGRAVPSQPTAGFFSTKGSMIGSSPYPVYGSAFGASSSASSSASALDGEDAEEYMRKYQDQGAYTKAPGLTARQRHLEEAKFMEMHANMRRGGRVF